MVDADPMTIAVVPDEASFKSRLQRSERYTAILNEK
jgi:hypothetical protein